MIMKHLNAAAFGCLCFFYVSCSSAVTELYDVRSIVLYDFQKTQTAGNMRLAVYAHLNRDADKSGFLQIKSPASDYIWTIEKPLFVHDTESGYIWVGCSDIVPPPGSVFPPGRYVLIYADAAGKKTEAFFDISEQKPIDKLDMSTYTKEKLGIFSETGLLLGYLSENTDMTVERAAEKYPGTFFTRIILLSDDGLSAVLREPVFIEDGAQVKNQGGVR